MKCLLSYKDLKSGVFKDFKFYSTAQKLTHKICRELFIDSKFRESSSEILGEVTQYQKNYKNLILTFFFLQKTQRFS